MNDAITQTQSPDQGPDFIFALLPCCMIPVVALFFVLWIWALIDCLRRDFKNNDKIIWVLVIVLLNWIGALIYLVIGRSQGKMPSDDASPSDGIK